MSNLDSLSMTLRAFSVALLSGSLWTGFAYADKDSGRDVEAIANTFFAALEHEDAELALSLLAPEAMLHAPYNPNGDASDAGIRSFPASLYVKGALATYDNLVFVNRHYSITDDGRTVWIEAQGRLRVAASGRPYENRYVFKIALAEGKIEAITEYTNVATLAQQGVIATAPD